MTDFVTDAEIARRWGDSIATAKMAIRAYERQGFPPRDPLHKGKRYWPAVEDFMRRRYGISMAGPVLAPDGEEQAFNGKNTGRPRPRVATTNW